MALRTFCTTNITVRLIVPCRTLWFLAFPVTTARGSPQMHDIKMLGIASISFQKPAILYAWLYVCINKWVGSNTAIDDAAQISFRYGKLFDCTA